MNRRNYHLHTSQRFNYPAGIAAINVPITGSLPRAMKALKDALPIIVGALAAGRNAAIHCCGCVHRGPLVATAFVLAVCPSRPDGSARQKLPSALRHRNYTKKSRVPSIGPPRAVQTFITDRPRDGLVVAQWMATPHSFLVFRCGAFQTDGVESG